MSDDNKKKKEALTQTGMMPRSILEPETKQEPKRPTSLPEHIDHNGATTGTYPAVIEGEDDITNQDEAYSAGH